MSDKTTADLTLERVNRLTLAVADLTESQTAQGRQLLMMMQRMTAHLERIETQIAGVAKDVRELATEQVSLGNRVENAFSRALRANIRLDNLEDELRKAD
jgi:hypothetical protein